MLVVITTLLSAHLGNEAKRLLTLASCPLLSLFAENNDKSIVKRNHLYPRFPGLGPSWLKVCCVCKYFPWGWHQCQVQRRGKRGEGRDEFQGFFNQLTTGVGFHKEDVEHTLQFPSNKHIWIPKRVFQVEAPLGQAIVVLIVWENPAGFMPDRHWVKSRRLLAWPEFSFTWPPAGRREFKHLEMALSVILFSVIWNQLQKRRKGGGVWGIGTPYTATFCRNSFLSDRSNVKVWHLGHFIVK